LAVPGAVIAGKYRLEGPIGAGGMGSVWAAVHVGLGQRIAIKLVSPDLVRSADALRRFDVEAKAAVQMRSRHIPQVYDNGILADGTPYIAMELLHGEPLMKRVERLGPIPLAEAVSILTQCCRALTRAHALGIVHRDIKPDNIYLAQSDDDDGYVVKVLDFGVAKMPVTVQDAGAQTRTGALVGTPAFMSPEQARGLTSIDARSDLYSLGLVAYQMLTGRQCFTAQSLGDMLLQICVQPLPSLLAGAPLLPPAMEAWFHKGCGRAPEDRFATAAAMSEALLAASGLSASELAVGAKGSGSSIPAVAASLGTVAAAAPSLPQIASTTGASMLSGTHGLPSRRLGAFVAAAFGVLTLGIAITVVALFARSRGPEPPSLGASSTTLATIPPEPAPPAVVDVRPSPAASTALDAGPPAKPKGSATPRPAGQHPTPVPPAKRAPRPAPNDNAVGY
jgi:serine/threonine-protein kinase